jgi:hypothetical protein
MPERAAAPRVYAFPAVGRAGLGNVMLPWARCEVFRQQHGLPMLAPQWTQPKLGPLLRGERDKRYYVGLFTSTGYIAGWRKHWILATSAKVDEDQGPALLAGTGPGRRTVVVFNGTRGDPARRDYFGPLLPHRALLARRLGEILAPGCRRRLEQLPDDGVIGVHLRRGDKPTLAFGAAPPDGAGDHWTPAEEWFVRAIRNVRQALGWDAPVRLFTDARPEQIPRILGLPQVQLAPPNPAIVDILALARARIVIPTGSSTFSHWAIFLGQMPTLWYPGTRRGLHPDDPAADTEADLRGGFAPGFAAVLRTAAPPPTAAP